MLLVSDEWKHETASNISQYEIKKTWFIDKYIIESALHKAKNVA